MLGFSDYFIFGAVALNIAYSACLHIWIRRKDKQLEKKVEAAQLYYRMAEDCLMEAESLKRY